MVIVRDNKESPKNPLMSRMRKNKMIKKLRLKGKRIQV